PSEEARESPFHPRVDPGLVADDDGVVRERASQRLDQARGRLGVPRVGGPAESGAPGMIPAVPRPGRAQTLEHPHETVPRVADDPELRLEEPPQYGRIEVEVDQRLRRAEREIQQE